MNRLVKCTEEELAYLDGVMGQLSDGIWENSRAMEPYWMCNDLTPAGIELKLYDDSYRRNCLNPLYDKSDVEVREWFAKKLKAVVKTFLEDENLPADEWNRVNEREVDYLRRGQTIAGAYKVYDSLMGRESKSGKVVKRKVMKSPSEIAVGDIVMDKEKVVQVYPPFTSKDHITTIICDSGNVYRLDNSGRFAVTEIKTIS